MQVKNQVRSQIDVKTRIRLRIKQDPKKSVFYDTRQDTNPT
jgi:hypothetical protein